MFQIPVALYEVLALIEDRSTDYEQMRVLVESIINVALDDPEAWLKIEGLAQSGYRLAFVPQENGQHPGAELTALSLTN